MSMANIISLSLASEPVGGVNHKSMMHDHCNSWPQRIATLITALDVLSDQHTFAWAVRPRPNSKLEMVRKFRKWFLNMGNCNRYVLLLHYLAQALQFVDSKSKDGSVHSLEGLQFIRASNAFPTQFTHRQNCSQSNRGLVNSWLGNPQTGSLIGWSTSGDIHSKCDGNWITVVQSDSLWSSLATSTTADNLQNSSSGVQVSTRHGPRILPGVLPANVNCRLPTSPVCWLRLTGCSPHQDELRRPQFRRPGTTFVEQSSCWTLNIRRWAGHTQAQTENIFI